MNILDLKENALETVAEALTFCGCDVDLQEGVLHVDSGDEDDSLLDWPATIFKAKESASLFIQFRLPLKPTRSSEQDGALLQFLNEQVMISPKFVIFDDDLIGSGFISIKDGVILEQLLWVLGALGNGWIEALNAYPDMDAMVDLPPEDDE